MVLILKAHAHTLTSAPTQSEKVYPLREQCSNVINITSWMFISPVYMSACVLVVTNKTENTSIWLQQALWIPHKNLSAQELEKNKNSLIFHVSFFTKSLHIWKFTPQMSIERNFVCGNQWVRWKMWNEWMTSYYGFVELSNDGQAIHVLVFSPFRNDFVSWATCDFLSQYHAQRLWILLHRVRTLFGILSISVFAIVKEMTWTYQTVTSLTTCRISRSKGQRFTAIQQSISQRLCMYEYKLFFQLTNYLKKTKSHESSQYLYCKLKQKTSICGRAHFF